MGDNRLCVTVGNNRLLDLVGRGGAAREISKGLLLAAESSVRGTNF